MHSPHSFDIKSIKPQTISNGGNRTIANSYNFPILKGMATYSLLLKKGGVREPHWHPNASELSYRVSGKALMTIFGHGDTHNTFTLERDEIAFVGDNELLLSLFFTSLLVLSFRLYKKVFNTFL